MADYRVTDTQLSSIANAIRTKGGTSASLVFPSGFVSAVENIPTGGGVLISKTISQNGSYSAADDNADGYSDVIVNVSGGSSPVLVSKSISQNGTYNPSDDNADAYSQVVVDVSSGGGSDNNFLITLGAISGSIYDTDVSIVRSSVFFHNSMITGVEMKAVTSIGSSAFGSCSNLEIASFPSCVNVSHSAFMYCVKLTSISFPACTNISENAFAYCNIRELDLPSCVNLHGYCFFQNANMSIVNAPVCQQILGSAFRKCTNLQSISIPECKYIETYAFMECPMLQEIILPKCSKIKNSAFYSCSRLSKVILLSSSVCALATSDTFGVTPLKNSSYLGYFGSIYVPASLVDAYKSAANWSYYSDRITSYVEE